MDVDAEAAAYAQRRQGSNEADLLLSGSKDVLLQAEPLEKTSMNSS